MAETPTAAEIEALIARLNAPHGTFDANKALRAEAAAALAAQAQRIAELERENTAIRTLMNCYNLGGWTDSIQVLQRAEQAEGTLRQAVAERKELMRWAVEACALDSEDEPATHARLESTLAKCIANAMYDAAPAAAPREKA